MIAPPRQAADKLHYCLRTGGEEVFGSIGAGQIHPNICVVIGISVQIKAPEIRRP